MLIGKVVYLPVHAAKFFPDRGESKQYECDGEVVARLGAIDPRSVDS